MKNYIFFICLLISSSALFAQEQRSFIKSIDPLVTKDSIKQKEWVDAQFEGMSLDEKIGQLFTVFIMSKQPQKETDSIITLINEDHIGGVIFSQGGPVRQAKLTNEYQAAAKVPLMIGQDAEWGLAMRLDSTFSYPWNMTLGAIDNKKLIRSTGAHIAKDAKRIGVNIDFAPVVDININPNNPIIGNRSFGENKENVTEKGIAFMKGMEGEGVLTSAKHFPGHGDTDVDSHKALPLLDFTRERLDSIELYPYRKIIPAGVSGVLVGHLEVPALDKEKSLPSSLSKPIVTGLLKEDYGFKGLVITDALGMKGVATPENPGEASLEAFLAGNDVLLMPEDISKAIEKIKQAYDEGTVSDEHLTYSVKKILKAKYKAGLDDFRPIDTTNLVKDLNTLEDELLYSELMENAVTVIKNTNFAIPIRNLDKEKIAYVHMGDVEGDAFYKMLNKYAKVDKIRDSTLNGLMKKLKGYNNVIVGFHKPNENPWQDYKFSDKERKWLKRISKKHNTILNVFARPYTLSDLDMNSNFVGIVVGYQNSKIAQEKTAQILFGALGAKGRLPVSISEEFPEGTQIKTETLNRLSYGIPESVGINSSKLNKIDSIAKMAVSERMTPGMQVLVARKGRVVFQRNYGYHTYDKKLPVKNEDVYDIASMTKILGSIPLYMQLYDKGDIDLDMTLKEILPFLAESNKADITLKEVLSHYGRLTPFISFYKKTLDDDGRPSSEYYRRDKDSVFSVKVADELFMRKDFKDTIYKGIAESDLLPEKKYVYSDFPFYLSKKFFESHYGADMNELTQNHFYNSLGANYIGYLPLKRFYRNDIIPTEIDDYFRYQPIQGYVHDEGAAMLDGTSGHAGLFSNANDVAKMMQMYLNGGTYGGRKYFNKETFDTFNTCYYCDEDVHRGIGFDKRQFEEGMGPASDYNSKDSFGHTGFTGTKTWVNPDEELLHVVLSNYVHPDRSRRKFVTEDIRVQIEDIIYEAIESFDTEDELNPSVIN